MVQVTGTVTDDVPSNCTVNLTGVVQASTAVNPDGTFAVQTNASALGQVTASAVDTVSNLSSAQFVAVFSVPPPEIQNFGFIHEAGNIWTFTGSVASVPPGNIPVTFGGPGGLANATVNTNPDGTFTITVTLTNPPPIFTVTAVATDAWGQQSSEVCLFLNT
jgi:hypothetical protein